MRVWGSFSGQEGPEKKVFRPGEGVFLRREEKSESVGQFFWTGGSRKKGF